VISFTDRPEAPRSVAGHEKKYTVTQHPRISPKVVLFDFIGTTVKEKNADIINTCFEQAFIENNVQVDAAVLKPHRGKNKMDMLEAVLKSQNLPVLLAPILYTSFLLHVEKNINDFCEMEGAGNLFTMLRKKKIKIGLGTGLPRELFEKIMHHLKWQKSTFSYTGVAEEVGRSRPHPDMILDMIVHLKISDPREILKVGDTIADIQEGKNAGVLTAVLLSGTQDQQDLLKEKPDFTLNTLSEIGMIVN
jgi:beta-phosphoglucomutase-like phosphatase (HAD superfamily)